MKLGENTAKFSIADRAALHRGLALRSARLGLEQAEVQAMLACQADRSSVAAWLLLFDLHLLGRDTSAMEKVLDEIRCGRPERGVALRRGRAAGDPGRTSPRPASNCCLFFCLALDWESDWAFFLLR